MINIQDVYRMIEQHDGICDLAHPDAGLPSLIYGTQLFYVNAGFPLPRDGKCEGLTLLELLKRAKESELKQIGELSRLNADNNGFIVYVGLDVGPHNFSISPRHHGSIYSIPNEGIERILALKPKLTTDLESVGVSPKNHQLSLHILDNIKRKFEK